MMKTEKIHMDPANDRRNLKVVRNIYGKSFIPIAIGKKYKSRGCKQSKQMHIEFR